MSICIVLIKRLVSKVYFTFHFAIHSCKSNDAFAFNHLLLLIASSAVFTHFVSQTKTYKIGRNIITNCIYYVYVIPMCLVTATYVSYVMYFA